MQKGPRESRGAGRGLELFREKSKQRQEPSIVHFEGLRHLDHGESGIGGTREENLKPPQNQEWRFIVHDLHQTQVPSKTNLCGAQVRETVGSAGSDRPNGSHSGDNSEALSPRKLYAHHPPQTASH